MNASTEDRLKWGEVVALFVFASMLKVLLAPGLYHSTDFEVHRNWLAVTHSKPLKEWYWEHTSEWTLDYPPLFGCFQWMLSQAAVIVEPDLVKITPYYDPSEAAVWFQRISVMVTDISLVFGVMAWSKGKGNDRRMSVSGDATESGSTSLALAALVLLNSALVMVDHIHFQYNGFLLGLLLLSMGMIRQGRVLLGGATFACLLMLKHLFLALAPLYFVYLFRSYCYDIVVLTQTTGDTARPRDACSSNSGTTKGYVQGVYNTSKARPRGGRDKDRNIATAAGGKHTEGVPLFQEAMCAAGKTGPVRLSVKRLTALGSVVLCVFGSALGPLCVSAGWTKDACARQLIQLGVRLFPFGRGLVHAYWAPNVWALYLFLDRVLLAGLKAAGFVGSSEAEGSTTGGLVQTEVMAVLPSIPAGLCLLLSLLACSPALLAAWRRPTAVVFASGVMHCSLSAFLVGFHVHEKALLVPAIVSALLAFQSRAGARMYLRLSFLAAFAVFPLLPGPELRPLKVLLVTAHLALAKSLLQHRFPSPSVALLSPPGTPLAPRAGSPPPSSRTRSRARKQPTAETKDSTLSARPGGGTSAEKAQEGDLVTVWDKVYVAGGAAVFVLGEMIHPWAFGEGGVLEEGRMPFLPLMAMSVYGAGGLLVCWGLSVLSIRTWD